MRIITCGRTRCAVFIGFILALSVTVGVLRAIGQEISSTPAGQGLDTTLSGQEFQFVVAEVRDWEFDYGDFKAYMISKQLLDMTGDKTAIEVMEDAAAQGNPWLQNFLGDVYFFGWRVDANTAIAREWYAKSARQGLPEALVNLGGLYAHGISLPKDVVLARDILTLAMERGNDRALFDLFVLYRSHPARLGREHTQALLERANERNIFAIIADGAERGDARDQYRLGDIYEKGYFGQKENERSKEWYALSMAAAYEPAMNKFMSPFSRLAQELTQNPSKETYEALLGGYNPNNAYDLFFLGMYREKNMQDMGKYYGEVEKWYLRAAEFDLTEAKFGLFDVYSKADNPDQDPQKAYKWLWEAANDELGPTGVVENAQFQLALAYREGAIVPKDEAAFIKWLQLSAGNGLAKAQHRLGHCYIDGYGLEKDPDMALHWLKMALERGIECDVAKRILSGGFGE